MPKTVFVNGTVVTPEFLNSINNPVYVDVADNDGEIAKLTNDALSGTAGQLKPEWTAFKDAFRVAPSTGLGLTYQGGSVQLPNNAIATVTPGSLNVPDNATSYIYVKPDGTVGVGASLPTFSVPMAQVTAAAGQITAVVDLRPRSVVLARQNAIRIFGGSGDQGDFVATSGTTTLGAGEYYYKNFTVGAAASVVLSQATTLHVAGDLTIDGTITCDAIVSGGSGIASSIVGGYFQRGGGFGGGGLSGAVSDAYAPETSRLGSGGGSGQSVVLAGGGAGTAGNGGKGGGSLQIRCGGKVSISASGSILARGGNGDVGSLISSSASGDCAFTGSGGGSGGLVGIYALGSIAIAGTLDVRGGAGGNALSFANSAGSRGGGGGGGGRIELVCPTVNTAGSTIILTGGAFGSTVGGSTYVAGCGGSFGGVGGDGLGSGAGAVGVISIRNFLPVG